MELVNIIYHSKNQISHYSFSELSIPFETAELALVAYNSLRVDKEPKRSSTFKTFYITDNCLKV